MSLEQAVAAPVEAAQPDPGAEGGEVLVVAGTLAHAALLKWRIESELGLRVHIAQSEADARRQLLDRPGRFSLVLLDLDLAPDAAGREALLGLVESAHAPAAALSARFDPALRDALAARACVLDYHPRDNPACDDALVGLARRLARNRETAVLVVDDSPTSRYYLARQLRFYRYRVHVACNGLDALAVLERHPEVSLVVTDYSMPGMDGFELVQRLRQRHARDRLAIIGLSASGDQKLSARFIKSGANDFLVKPFVEEEFHCRVTQNVEMLDHIQALREAAVRDFLTGLHNRRYFFDAGERMHASARRGQLALAAAMVDIDHFKRINDGLGHEAGDTVLRRVAGLLGARFRGTDIVARMGGEEFCVLAVNLDAGAAARVFDGVRRAIEEEVIIVAGKRVPVTASIGVCCGMRDSLEMLVGEADDRLYAAKVAGRNRIAVA